MAFWDNWFKVDCQECKERFDKEELSVFDGRDMCSPCQTKIEEKRATDAAELELRRAAQEKARAALLDRPMDVSGKAFGASAPDKDGSVF
jgi:hypothetical protein